MRPSLEPRWAKDHGQLTLCACHLSVLQLLTGEQCVSNCQQHMPASQDAEPRRGTETGVARARPKDLGLGHWTRSCRCALAGPWRPLAASREP